MGTGKKKIEIKRVVKKEQRMVTFSKRRQGLFKKAHQLHCKTGAHIAILVFSPSGRPYIDGHPSFHATIDRYLSCVKEPNDDCKTDQFRLCLNSMQVEAYDRLEDLLALKKELENICGMLMKKLG